MFRLKEISLGAGRVICDPEVPEAHLYIGYALGTICG